MKDFLLVFRRDFVSSQAQPSPQQLQDMMQHWQHWMGDIAAQNKLVSAGSRLAAEGKVVKSKTMVTDGPYMEIKEAIGGYIIVRAETIDEAAELSKGCPVLFIGGNVEVRQVIAMDDNVS